MNLSTSLTRRLRGSSQATPEYIPRPTQASLDDLYATALTLGEVKMGMTFDAHGAEIRLHDHKVNGDYVWVRSKTYPTLKENLAVCIQRASALVQFYQSM